MQSPPLFALIDCSVCKGSHSFALVDTRKGHIAYSGKGCGTPWYPTTDQLDVLFNRGPTGVLYEGAIAGPAPAPEPASRPVISDDPLHPTGRCTCAGEGTCTWCRNLYSDAAACVATRAFAIGADRWPGISKLVEECGEVQQVAGKLLGTYGERDHWDGSDLKRRLQDELGDLLAAIDFVVLRCGLRSSEIFVRRRAKFSRFELWHQQRTTPSGAASSEGEGKKP